MTQHKIKFIFLTCLTFLAPMMAWAQEVKDAATGVAPIKSSYNFDINTALTIVAALLLFPIFAAAKTFIIGAANYNKTKKSGPSNITKSGLVLIMLFSSQLLFAQTKAAPELISGTFFTYLILIVIAIEIALIMFLSSSTSGFIHSITHESIGAEYVEAPSLIQRFKNLWNKSNNFIPIEEESKLDTGHSYDGIRELDNITPPWFTAAFLGTILFGIVYLYTRHVSHTAPLQIQEYETAMAQAEEEKNEFLATQSNNIDENTVRLLTGPDVEAGKAIFLQKCVACHSENGASKPGGVGPNLTDDHWIHGGSVQNIFASIKNGWPEKGMISWKDQIAPKQMAQIASFIKSIKGTVAAGGKEPQGEVYTESAAATTTDTAAAKPAVADTLKK